MSPLALWLPFFAAPSPLSHAVSICSQHGPNPNGGHDGLGLRTGAVDAMRRLHRNPRRPAPTMPQAAHLFSSRARSPDDSTGAVAHGTVPKPIPSAAREGSVLFMCR